MFVVLASRWNVQLNAPRRDLDIHRTNLQQQVVACTSVRLGGVTQTDESTWVDEGAEK